MLNLHYAYQWTSFWATVIAALIGLWRGRWEGRVVSIAMCSAWWATGLVHRRLAHGLETGVMTVDLILEAVLLVVAFKSGFWWPMWAAGFHGLSCVLHGAVVLDPKIWGRSSYIAEGIFSYLAVAALGIGVLVEIRGRTADPPTRPRAAYRLRKAFSPVVGQGFRALGPVDGSNNGTSPKGPLGGDAARTANAESARDERLEHLR